MLKIIKITVNNNEEKEIKVYMKSFKIDKNLRTPQQQFKLLNVQFPTFS